MASGDLDGNGLVNAMVTGDFDGDGNLDVVPNGNEHWTDVSIVRYDALNGFMLRAMAKVVLQRYLY